MISVNVNISGLSEMVKLLSNIGYNKDAVVRSVATTLRAEVAHRIHVEGLDSNGNPIGQYSDGYMSVRTGIYKSNDVYSKGKNKGKPKPTGVFTKGKNKGLPRPKYNRTPDKKVIISLRGGQGGMESDFRVIDTQKGYGLGFSHQDNFDNSKYVESTYKKKIFDLTPRELEIAQETAEAETERLINAIN